MRATKTGTKYMCFSRGTHEHNCNKIKNADLIDNQQSNEEAIGLIGFPVLTIFLRSVFCFLHSNYSVFRFWYSLWFSVFLGFCYLLIPSPHLFTSVSPF